MTRISLRESLRYNCQLPTKTYIIQLKLDVTINYALQYNSYACTVETRRHRRHK